MTAILQITDGTTTIDLIKGAREYGFHLDSWRPSIAGYKGGGTWQESALSTGRQIVDKQFSNYVDTFGLKANQTNQDSLIYELQEIRRLLEKASSYWTTDWQNEPVYLVAKATDETNTRYSLIYTGAIPEDEQPYSQPFLQPLCMSVMNNLTLVIEHGFWTENAPGTGTCVETGVSKAYDGGPPYYLEFNGVSPAGSSVNVPDAAALQNLPAADFTLDGWFKEDGTGWGGNGFAFSKENGAFTTGYHVETSVVVGVEFKIDFATTDMRYSAGPDEWSADGEWHYLAFVFDSATKTARIWIDTQEVSSYLVSQAGVGAYSGDIGDDIYIGNIAAGARTWDGDIGWVRLSTGKLHSTSTITLPTASQCVLPVVVAATVGQWIGFEGSGAAILDQDIAAGNDGTQANCTFGACGMDYGNTDGDTCDDEVYIANKQNTANITHIIYYDSAAATYSVNKQGTALPYNIFDLPVVPGDIVYFGIETGIADSGPFLSLVFDIGTVLDVDSTWEYWNGAWVALTVQDNTDADGAMTGMPLDTAGVNSVHWGVIPDWATTDPGMGVTGYWVRLRITGVATGSPPPTQQNRQIYSIVWPYIDIDSTQVLGDIAALSRLSLRNEIDGSALSAETARAIVGLRSLSRGQNFSAYLNCADEQNPPGVTVALGGAAAWATSIEAPSGRLISYTNPPAAWTTTATFTISSTYATEYIGEYHAFLRGRQLTSGTIQTRAIFYFNNLNQEICRSDEPIVAYTGAATLPFFADFGKIPIAPYSIKADEASSIIIEVQLYGDGVADIYLYDLILIPADEWIIDSPTSDPLTYVGDRDSASLSSYLDIDSVLYPKQKIRSLSKFYSTDLVSGFFISKTASSAILQANASQRLWVIVDDPYNTIETSLVEVAHSIRVFKLQRYLSMRGRR